jgi:hypothetical protein
MSEAKPAKLPTSTPEAPAQARDQAAEYSSPFAPSKLTLDDGYVIEIPPHPSLQMFDDEAQAELDALHLDLEENYERHPDVQVPEQTVYDKVSGKVISVFPPTTQRGALKEPYRKKVGEKTELMNPPYKVRVVQIAIGEENYARLRAGTVDGHRGSAADVWRIWSEKGLEVAKREKEDTFRQEGSVDLEAVPTPDSD